MTKSQQAEALCNAGKIQRAAELCAEALREDPEDAGAHFVQGLIAARRGDPDAAVAALNRAIAIDKLNPGYHHALGNALQDQRKFDRAISCYRRALRLNADYAEAHNDLGTAYFEKGWLEEAAAEFGEAIRLRPDHDAAHANLGSVLRAQGKLSEARKLYQRSLWIRVRRGLFCWLPGRAAGSKAPTPRAKDEAGEIRRPAAEGLSQMLAAGKLDEVEARATEILKAAPDDPEALHAIGYAAWLRGNTARAIDFISRAIAHAPSVARFHNNLGNAYLQSQRFAEAADSLRRATDLDPGLAAAHNNLANALRQLGRYEDALAAADRAVALDPGLAFAHASRGDALFLLERHDESLASFRRAVQLAPRHAESWNSLGSVYIERHGDLRQAEECFRHALEINPNDALAHHNMGVLAQIRGDLDGALAKFRLAQRLEPAAVASNFSEALLHLLRGDFERGWSKYHWRTVYREWIGNYPKTPVPAWDGSPLRDASILVYAEQGLGDEIMFASCVGEITAAAKRSIVACRPRLANLFRRSFPRAEILTMKPQAGAAWIEEAPATDYIAAMGDLPRYLRPDSRSFPDHRGYLQCDPGRVRNWRERLQALGEGPKIGISWRGGTKLSWKGLRSLALEDLISILGLPRARFISLQYGSVADEIERFRERHGITLHHWQEAIDDYDETAALVGALDLTVSVCTAVVHLAGALGRPVWVMAPLVPEWRYGLAGERMIWYPSSKVFRQEQFGAWTGVIDRVRNELTAMIQ